LGVYRLEFKIVFEYDGGLCRLGPDGSGRWTRVCSALFAGCAIVAKGDDGGFLGCR
jgi:hypothetical protein